MDRYEFAREIAAWLKEEIAAGALVEFESNLRLVGAPPEERIQRVGRNRVIIHVRAPA